MERLKMSRLREILRLRWDLGRSVRETSRATSASTGVISKTVGRAQKAGLSWEMVKELGDAELEARVYGGPRFSQRSAVARPDPVSMHVELRKAGVTLELLHLEYLEEQPEGLRYTAFCDVYRRWKKRQRLYMRQRHRAGEKLFVDYSGKRPRITDPTTGETRPVELFVAVLGASNFTYAEATESQKVTDFVISHARAFEYIGGVPEIVVPDQLRSAVSVPCRYEPTINRTYADLGTHYGTAIVPARPRKPKDKAKVEVAVQVAQRWILACLRHETFFSLAELNRRIRELCDRLNDRPMRRLGGRTRRQLFEYLDKPVLKPLPREPYVPSEWLRATVASDYHVSVDHHFYSAPHTIANEEVEVRLTATTVEIFFLGIRAASHVRSDEKYGHTTDEAHMPESHRAHLHSGEVLMEWAVSVGPNTEAMARRLLERSPVAEQGWRSVRGLRRVERSYGALRFEKACGRALELGATSYRHVERLLKLGREDGASSPSEGTMPNHENLRGSEYYH